MDPCSSGNRKSSAKRTIERKEKQQQIQLEFNAHQRWQQTHGGIVSQSQKTTRAAGVFSAVFGKDEGENTGCRMSECCSPTSDILGITDHFRGTNTADKNLGLSLLGARPLGNIEKVLEYRTILNGKSVELRRSSSNNTSMIAYHINILFVE